MLTQPKNYTIIIFAVNETAIMNVRLAQLDRASGYGPEGREFESSIARKEEHFLTKCSFCFIKKFFCLVQMLILPDGFLHIIKQAGLLTLPDIILYIFCRSFTLPYISPTAF